MDNISPRYQMSLVKSINDELFNLYRGYADVEQYIRKWYECDEYGNWENFNISKKKSKDGQDVIDTLATLHSMNGELLLKIAIDLGLETPDFIPSIPTFKNELKSSFETAGQTFEKAYHNVESDPSLAIGLANSALESIIKQILSDKRITIQYSNTDTTLKLINAICKAFRLNVDTSCPKEIKTISSSLIAVCGAIESLRSTKTEFHGKADGDINISDPTYAFLVVNSTATVGLFLINFYKKKYPATQTNILDYNNLPF